MISAFISFIKKPSQKNDNPPSKGQFIIATWLLFIGVCIIQLMVYISLDNYLILPPNKVSAAIKNQSYLETILMAIVIMPIIEEAGFRLGLVFSKINFKVSATAFFFLIFFVFLQTSLTLSAVFAVAIFVFFHLLMKKNLTDSIKGFYQKHNGKIIWVSIICFALLHANNFFSPRILFVLPLLVIPQLFTGFICSYARINFGFFYAVIIHAIFNLLPVSIMLIGKYYS